MEKAERFEEMPQSSGSEKTKDSIRLTEELRSLIKRIQRETGQNFSETLRMIIIRGATEIASDLAETRSLDNKILVTEKLKLTLLEMGVTEKRIKSLLFGGDED